MKHTDWQAYSCEVSRLISELMDALYAFEKERIAIDKKMRCIEKPQKREKLGNLLADAEDALMDIEGNFSRLAAIGDFIDEELV